METNLKKAPLKPTHYLRDNIIIFALALGILGIGLYLNMPFAGGLATLFAIVAHCYRFRAYYAQCRDCREARIHSLSAELKSNQNVNENIERYVAAQRLKRAQASWWQFWV